MAMTLDMALSNGVALNMSSAAVSAPSPLMAARPRKNKTVRSCRRRTRTRAAGVRVSAKYGERSVYFDLEDMGNTTGDWDLYGSDAPSPYNPLQSKFFETFAAPFTKRGLLLKFLLLGGGGALLYASTAATGDILPIKRGPQLPPVPGPQGKL